jgi:hypothetical protein
MELIWIEKATKKVLTIKIAETACMFGLGGAIGPQNTRIDAAKGSIGKVAVRLLLR